MFGKKASSDNETEFQIPIMTTDVIPGRSYETLDVILSEKHRRFTEEFSKIKTELREQAQKINADAVIGMRLLAPNSSGFSDVCAYGTAIRFTDGKGGSE